MFHSWFEFDSAEAEFQGKSMSCYEVNTFNRPTETRIGWKWQDVERERRRKYDPDSMDEDVEEEIAEIKAAHFEESMKYARRSVSDADIGKYQAFARTLQQSRGFGSEFRFAESATGAFGSNPFASAADAADEHDLYS